MSIKKGIKSFIRVILLAISFLVLTFFSTSTKAEILQDRNLRFEKVNALSKCTGSTCFKQPGDIVIANDGSFFLVVDSSVAGESGIYLRRFNYSVSGFTEGGIIPLIQSSTNAPLLKLELSQNNNKVLAYREPTDDESTLVQIVNLQDNSVKELKSITADKNVIGKPTFADTEGKFLIAGTIFSKTPELVSIDVEADRILERLLVGDSIDSIFISPNYKSAAITFSDRLTRSILVSDLENDKDITFTIDPSLDLLTDDFLSRVNFDITGNKLVISSVGGAHVLHYIDLESNKLTSELLDKSSDGQVLSTITPDGKNGISVGNFDSSLGFKVYKTNLKGGAITLLSSALFSDLSSAIDVDITPDQSKILILTLKSGIKRLKVLNFKDLTQEGEFDIGKDSSDSFLILDPLSRYAVTPNTTGASISTITDINAGPILKSITPNAASLTGGTPFKINGFVDPLQFTDLKVCFKNNDFCAASVNISRTGQTITGFTPKFIESGFQDVIITARSKLDGSSKSSKYEGIFQFTKEGIVTDDTLAPEITISAPQDLQILNTRRILVLGKADGTGSDIESVLINNKVAKLTIENQASPNVANFIGDVQFGNDGIFEIKVTAKDKSANTSEKLVNITIDTAIPTIKANIEQITAGNFKVTGTASGTGSNISTILVNSVPVQFQQGTEVNFSATTNKLPVNIKVTDKAGNKNELTIANPLTADNTPPEITIISPASGEIIKGSANISILFTISDETGVKEVFVNGNSIPLSTSNQYSNNLTLKPGENLVFITATDTSDNKSSSTIKVTYISSDLEEIKPTKISIEDLLQEKEIITLPPDIEDINTGLIEQFTGLTETTGGIIDLTSTLSVEIANPPFIPEGASATIEIPKIEGIEALETPTEIPEIPKGFSIATNVVFKDEIKDTVQLTKEEQDITNTAILVDSVGRTFVVGFGFLKKVNIESSSSTRTKNFRFQTTEGEPLELTTTVTIPGDANEGDATVSILSKNESLASIPLKIAPSKEVKIGKRTIGKPQINEPIVATVKKSGTKLTLKIKGKNFLGRVAIIDGQLERLIGKTKFFTNVTFVPTDGIKIKPLKVSKESIKLTAELESTTSPGIKLFNVITPKGADIGAIVFPDPIVDGSLQTTTTPESLILGD